MEMPSVSQPPVSLHTILDNMQIPSQISVNYTKKRKADAISANIGTQKPPIRSELKDAKLQIQFTNHPAPTCIVGRTLVTTSKVTKLVELYCKGSK